MPTLETFTADVMQAGIRSEIGCKAEFVVVEGVGHTLLGQEAAVEPDILRIARVQANSISGEIDSDIRGRYSYLFNGVGLI